MTKTLYEKAFELYKEFKTTLPKCWYKDSDFFRHSKDIMFEAYCEGWLSYGLKFITEFDHIILLVSRYGGGECSAYSIEVEPENEIRYAINNWLNTWDIDEETINFEFFHIEE